VGIWHVEVEQTVYSTADTISAQTFAWGTPQDWGAMSQKFNPLSMIVEMGYPKSVGMSQLIYGSLDEIEVQSDSDQIEFRGRGILANLIDKKISIRPDMNSTITSVITKLISDAGLTPKVANSPIKVGGIINDENVGMSRNMRTLDFINALAYGAGWRVRTQGTTVIVGPPPTDSNTYVLKRTWGTKSGGTKMRVTHSAFHAHDIKVTVISYIPKTKAKISSTSSSVSALAASLGMSAPTSTTGKSKTTGQGRQSGSSASPSENPDVQHYVIEVANKTKAECDVIAANIRDTIARKEFKLDMTIVPTPQELQALIKAGTEFSIQLDGCPLVSNNGTYHPERVRYIWDLGSDGAAGGLTIQIQAVNHLLPTPAGGGTNATESSV
jgi:hypothetical protein